MAPENVPGKWCFLNAQSVRRKDLDKRGNWDLQLSLGKEVRNYTKVLRLMDPKTNSDSVSLSSKIPKLTGKDFRDMFSNDIF